jgi:hypothetical protein
MSLYLERKIEEGQGSKLYDQIFLGEQKVLLGCRFRCDRIQNSHLLTRGMACVGKCLENKISKPTKLDCKQNFYCTVYYITSNSNCGAQRAPKN